MSKGQILIAEDDSALRKCIAYTLEDEGYAVIEARDGAGALDALLRSGAGGSPVSLLITDIKMPGKGGLDLIRGLKENRLDVPVVVITGHGDKKTLIELIRLGCDEFLNKPFDPDDLTSIVDRVLEKHRGRERKAEAVRKLSEEAELYRRRFESLRKEVSRAVHAYQDLVNVPREGHNVALAYRARPLGDLGGDYFDVADTESGCDVFLADVAGHDLAASYHTVLLKAFFEENARGGKDGRGFLELLNHVLRESGANERMVTACHLRLDLRSMWAEFTAAGHPGLILCRRDRDLAAETPITARGDVLGLGEEAVPGRTRFRLAPRDRLFLYTDGVINIHRVEGATGERVRLGEEGLRRVVDAHAGEELDEAVDRAMRDVLRFGRDKRRDDMLLLALEIPA